MTDAFEGWVRGGLARAGVEATDEDVEMLRLVDVVYEPALVALDQVDLGAVEAEPDLDPSRPPRA
ncbi:MAG TPA: hypothetical protein VIM22_01975 [Solirubrobacteraceae bacterium]